MHRKKMYLKQELKNLNKKGMKGGKILVFLKSI